MSHMGISQLGSSVLICCSAFGSSTNTARIGSGFARRRVPHEASVGHPAPLSVDVSVTREQARSPVNIARLSRRQTQRTSSRSGSHQGTPGRRREISSASTTSNRKLVYEIIRISEERYLPFRNQETGAYNCSADLNVGARLINQVSAFCVGADLLLFLSKNRDAGFRSLVTRSQGH